MITPEIKKAIRLGDQLDRDHKSGAGVKAFQAGQKARKAGFARVSTFYNKPHLDACFFAGYDANPSALPKNLCLKF